MSQEQIEPIDLDKIFQEKNPSVYKLLPKFVLSYLKRIIHQDDMNEFLAMAQDKYGADFAEAYISFSGLDVTVNGQENFPAQGERVIFAANHPLGGLDGISIVDQLGHRYPGIKFMVNDILMHMINLRPVLLPINKHGAQAREAARNILKAHESDGPIFTFPAGLVSRRQGGVVKDLKWGKNVVSNAIRYQRDIVPIHISGRNSNFFYNLSMWRKRLGIKANIEMLYLVNEGFKNHGKGITITIGKSVKHTTFTKEKTRDEWAQDLREIIYTLVD